MLKNLPKFLRDEVVSTSIYILNSYTTKAVEGKTPYEVWIGKKPNISYFRVFGYEAFSYIVFEKRKLYDKVEKCIFFNYDRQHRGYRLYSPSST